MALVVAPFGITINHFNVASQVGLLEAHAAVARQYVAHVDDHSFRLVGVRECVMVKCRPLGTRQLNSDSGAQRGLVVPNFAYIRGGSCVVVVGQRVDDISQDRHLRNDAILGCAACPTLVEHREPSEVAVGSIAGVCVRSVVEIWPKFDYAQWPAHSGKCIATVCLARLYICQFVIKRARILRRKMGDKR